MKKFLSVILSVLMLLGVTSVFVGCGDEKEDLTKFTVFVPYGMPDAIDGVAYENYADLPVYKELEKRTGIKVEYVHGDPTSLSALWTGGYYDVMMLNDTSAGGGYPGGLTKGVDDGVFWDLTPFMEESAPDYMDVIDSAPDSVKKFSKTDSNKRIGMYNVPLTDQGPWYGYVVREDWLKTYQIANGIITATEPAKNLVTYDDWEGYLTYVKNNLNGGKAPLFLYYTGADLASTLNAGFNVTTELYLKDGNTVAYGAMQDEFKAYLDKMKDWYSKGLIDANFTENNAGTQSQMPQAAAWDNYNKDTATYTPAQYAAFPMIYTWISKYEMLNMQWMQYYLTNGKLPYSLLPAYSPKQNATDTLHIRQTQQSSSYVAITNKVKSEEKVKKIMEWFNYLFTDEGMRLMNYGIEGESYTMVDNKPVFTDKIKKNGDFSNAVSTYATLNFVFGYEWEREFQVITPKEQKAMEEVWYNDASYILPTVTLTAQEGAVAALYQQQIKTYKDTFMANYIKGANTQSFDEFKTTMKNSHHVDDLVRVYAAAYERYKVRSI